MRLLKTIVLVNITFLFLNIDIFADRDVNESIALSEKLNELEMFDLSLYLLEKTTREKPNHKDMISVQKAQTLISMRDLEGGKRIINGIPRSSTAYAFSRYVLGISSIESGDNKTGVKALEEYFAYMVKNLPEANSVLGEQYQKGVSYLVFVYKKEGKVKELTNAMSYLEKLNEQKKPDDAPPDDEGTKYEKILVDAQTKLDAAEMMKFDNKPDWKPILEGVIPPLKEIYWSGQTSWSGLTAIELSKAYCLLENYDESLKELQTYWGLIKALDAGYREEELVPPSAKAYLWKGNSNMGLAEKTTEKEDKIKYLFNAAKCYLTIVAKYDNKKCFQTGKAVAGFNKARDLLKIEEKILKWPENIKLPSGFDRKIADDKFNKDKYEECIPLYMKVLQSPGGRSSTDAPDILNRVAYAYLETGKVLESLTLATYLGEYFPENKETPKALLRVGETLWKKYEQSPTTPAGKGAQDEALMLYKTFLKNCPTHEFADEISARSAKVYYDRANDLAREANKMPNGPEKIKKNEEARESFKEAIPIYQQILDNYLHTDLGKSSAYLLGWCYTNSRQYIKGAEVFAKYADAETNREKKEKRNFGQIADAKFRVAQNYTRAAGDLEKAAKQWKADAKSAPTESDLQASPPKAGKPVPLSEEALIKKSEDNYTKAIEYFKISVANLNELLEKWMKPGGRLAEATTKKDKDKINEIKEKAISLLAWSYDGTRDNENTIKAFKNFIEKYPKHKDIPRAMLRLGMLYIEENKANEAAAVLNELSAKFPEEGKKALPKLARTMYEIKKFDKSIDAAVKIFEGNTDEVPVSEIKWIARNLYDCEGTFPEKGALISLQACELLNKRIEKPVMAQWVGPAKAKALENDPEETAKIIGILKEQLLLFTGNAAFRSKQYKKAIDAFTKILSNSDTPYFLQGHFLRAESYLKNNEPKKALDNDFNAISLYLYGAKEPDSVSFRNQCLIGDAYIMLSDYNKALGAFSFVTMTLISNEADLELLNVKKEVTPAEKKKQRKWQDYAIFISACCEKKLGNDDKAKAMVTLYRKKFNQGKYKSKIDALPTPEEAMKLK